MYRWYAESDFCYVYLSDVRTASTQPGLLSHTELEKSRWFTRGWTLQEMIAPRLLEFYDVDWKTVGTKLHLCSRIIARTSIPESTLLEPWNLDFQEFPAGRRFSWAWDRTTTRDEDLAYSLMGLLGVSMPLLYGEGGGKAFIGSSKNTSCNGRTCRFFSGHRGLAAVLAPSWPDARPSSTLARSDISTGTQNPATSPMIALRGRMLFLSDTRVTLWPSPVEGCGSNFWPCEIARHTG